MPNNPLQPKEAVIKKIFQVTPTEKMFVISFLSEADQKEFEEHYDNPAKFVQVHLPGIGEVPISLCSPPTQKGFFALTIRKAGRVTTVIHDLKEGDHVWIRGPYGNGFPINQWKGKDLLFLSAGLGMAPLRSVFLYALDHRWDYGNITLINSARTKRDLLYYDELEAISRTYKGDGVKVIQTVTREEVEGLCKGRCHLYIPQANVDPKNSVVIMCGPPRMYQSIFDEVLERGFDPNYIYATFERRMKCGIGKCGHCNVGSADKMLYVCKDGPVFSYRQVQRFPALME